MRMSNKYLKRRRPKIIEARKKGTTYSELQRKFRVSPNYLSKLFKAGKINFDDNLEELIMGLTDDAVEANRFYLALCNAIQFHIPNLWKDITEEIYNKIREKEV